MATIKSSAENLTLNADGANNDIIFQSNGTTKATLDQAGLLTATSFAGSGANLTGVGVDGIVSNANATAMTIDSSERIGIGVAPSDHTLSIKSGDGTANVLELATGDSQCRLNFSRSGNPTAYIRMLEDGSGGTGALHFGVGLSHNPADALIIKSDGKVTVGSTSVNDPVVLIQSGGGGDSTLQFSSAGANRSGQIKFLDNGSAVGGFINYKHNGDKMEFGCGSSTTVGFRVADGYTNAAQGLTFGTDTAAANKLDDYEEGTWTPAISTTSGGSNMAYQNTTGHYRKIGGLVHVFGIVQLTAKNNLQAGNVFVQGFPFTMANPSGEGQGGNITEYGNFSVNFNSPCLAFYQSGRMFLKYTPADGSSTYTNVVGGNVNDNTYFRFNATYTT